MKYKIVIFLFITIIFYTCKNVDNSKRNTLKNEFTDFPETENVYTTIKNFKGKVHANQIFIVDSLLVVFQQLTGRGSYFLFYDKNSLEFIGRTAKRGRGPNEISIGVYPSVDTENKKIYICDHARNRLVYEFDIYKSMNNLSYEPVKLFEIGMEKLNTDNLTFIGNNSFMYYFYYSNNDSVEYNYTIVDKKGIKSGSYIEKTFGNHLPDGARKRLGFRSDCYRNNLIFTAYRHQDRLLCFDTKQRQLLFETKGPNLEEPEIELHGEYWIPFEKPRAVTYLSVAASDKYVYVLYSGEYETIKDYAPRGTKHIFVFDMQGKPVKRLELDRAVMQITYDDDENALICIQNDERTGLNTVGLVYVYLDKYGL